jgi:hypothetical protein
MSFEPTWKSLPTYGLVKQVLVQRLHMRWQDIRSIRSSFLALPYEMAAYRFLCEFTNSMGQQWSQGCLWNHRTRFAFDPNNKLFTGTDLDWYERERKIGPLMPTCDALGVPPYTGRLGQTLEGSGKRRVFAIGNYINQRLLYPVHQWLASVLRSIPMDGTFNQRRPLDLLSGSTECYSFDLKSATDRWPLLLMFETFQCLFDRGFASAVVNSTLGTNIFEIPFVKKRTEADFVCSRTTSRIPRVLAIVRLHPPFTGVVVCGTSLPWSALFQVWNTR